ncbi:hypothetical protein, partial [Roseovarius sp. 2305UL8-3]|uniref:hypothetical protein n=1 Tax=Roseovarius conchicola TaxID=3121636 RepID=UPI003528FFA1
VLLLIVASPLSAGDCRPDGMSDKEAERIITIATEQGQSFRAAIDKMRADGVTYRNDTAYDDLIANPEQLIALARERHGGRESSQYNNDPELLAELGYQVEGFLESNTSRWVKKDNYNYFTIELAKRLRNLAVLVGGEPSASDFRYKLELSKFVFALDHFAEGAEFKYLAGSTAVGDQYVTIYNYFSEKWAFRGRKPNYRIRIFLTTDPDGVNVTFDNIAFGPGDLLKNTWPLFQDANENCLASYNSESEK